MDNVSRVVHQIQPTTVVTRSQKDKLVRDAKQAQHKWKAARVLDHDTKQVLVNELRDLGWEVCWCHGEADLCISSQPGPVTVATADSDFLFHEVDTVLRQDPQDRASFRSFSIRDDVLAHLDLRQEAWTSIGVVSGNDYADNIPQQGINTNFKVIQSIQESDVTDPSDIIAEYCLRTSTKTQTVYDASRFQHAVDIFVRHHEDLPQHPGHLH